MGDHRVCPNCGYGFRLQAYERVHLMTTAFEEWDADLTRETDFPGYAEKLNRAKSQTKLNESVLTGQAVVKMRQLH